jgi:hypothetical protein
MVVGNYEVGGGSSGHLWLAMGCGSVFGIAGFTVRLSCGLRPHARHQYRRAK